MKTAKTIIALSMAFLVLFSTNISAGAYDLEEFGIKDISLPSGYSACTRENVQYSFSQILTANGYTHSRWVEEVMEEESLYICGRDSRGRAVNISVTDPSTESDKEQNLKYHQLMYDYNLYGEVAGGREKVMIDYRDELLKKSVEPQKIKYIKWFGAEEIGGVTPYIRGLYENAEGINICEYTTVYNGNHLDIMFMSPSEFSERDISQMDKMIYNIKHTAQIDYSHAKQVYRQNQRVTIPERLSSEQRKSSALIGLGLCFVTLVMITAIVITTTKIWRRTKSARNSRYRKY